MDRRQQMRKRKSTLMNSLQKNKTGMQPTPEKVYEELATKAIVENLDNPGKLTLMNITFLHFLTKVRDLKN